MEQVQENEKKLSNFFVIWIGQAFSLLGSQLVSFALVWWLTEKTGSATILALASMMAILPQVLLGPIVGALVDRWNRRSVMITADALIAALTALLAYLFLIDAVQVWHIYTIMLLRSLGGAFHWPAMQASTTMLVPEKHLARVNGMNQLLHGALTIMAPPLGALLLTVLPMQGILAIDVVTALLAVGALLLIHIPQPARAGAEAGGTSVWQDFREGLAFIWAWPGLMIVLGIAMILNLLVNPGFSLLPILVTKHFGGGAIELGLLESAWGVGMIVGGLLLSLWGGFKRRIVTGMAGIAGTGLGIIVLGLAPANMLWLAGAALAFSASTNAMSNGSLFAALQAVVPPDKQGRVFTIVMSGAMLMSPVGLVIAGPVADALGVQVWFLIGGAASVLLGIGAFFIPALMQIEEQVRPNGAAEGAPGDTAAPTAALPDTLSSD